MSNHVESTKSVRLECQYALWRILSAPRSGHWDLFARPWKQVSGATSSIRWTCSLRNPETARPLLLATHMFGIWKKLNNVEHIWMLEESVIIQLSRHRKRGLHGHTAQRSDPVFDRIFAFYLFVLSRPLKRSLQAPRQVDPHSKLPWNQQTFAVLLVGFIGMPSCISVNCSRTFNILASSNIGEKQAPTTWPTSSC